ncbi:hyastatin-like [Penaeus japonicus]|uniref:hyastatin-like n=1 Tax=Penaeus japonicus TaxID=27405 RepID=UPI001C70F06F|nr:hyastatin-like [Penaeus japonicus]
MAHNVAVTSFIVALCLAAAIAGHSGYGIGGHRPVVHSSGILGGVLGGVHGGLGFVGSGIHGAGSSSAAHYPGLVPGYSFYDHQPVLGYNQCKYWCKSHYTNKYYCCQRPYQG